MKGLIQKDFKKRAKNRLHIILGQVRGLEKMVEDEKYCIDILNQSLAIQESLKSFNGLMLENHLNVHAAKQFRGKDAKQAVRELLKIYKYNRK